ncbi:uncharacterized protein LOC100836941 [Brachypodium distachyon]|uniref:Disease resistance protein At4g27190-like leucine-rich repeats domain-containing protein n=2 Tax=Brachypodium distachyon TaxID=15368 RepID=A0A0Q3I983_BRADI|nr:uncharacterized protein LOC100836941 [Brachypodium distachyon]XP_024315030.1 uncharacterized protein LOC100836941 [Brachypodium distachyon]KQK02371.1 hypothetical protein BRADI_2g01070v3 [Brachypodium distachyon]PNT69824.1 hypothetical protein BRADI_2g01070v3 [Brachypodium distachyon]PNT69825.1 hypothetical protein BRADI_2g01070v3 [Brachypodium distachyon]|eukprot:XP_003565244.1 uncharacterized protein LOC100836941 [Brachypodium distachyon]
MGRPDKWQLDGKDVDSSRERILGIVSFEREGNEKVFYIDGWNGFGASAVLRSVAEVIPSRRTTPGLYFDRVIFIDCSKWKNRRAVQRAIAEELKLDSSVMSRLDEQDEKDDFYEVDESLRYEIDSVGKVIDQTLSGTKFIIIFLNGSDAEIDLGSFGIPPFTKFCENAMIWAFKRRCLTMDHFHRKVADELRYTHSFIYFSLQIEELTSSQFEAILHEEVADIVARKPCMLDIDPTIVANCCLYELFLLYNFHIATKFDWVPHASNYWICDAIIKEDKTRDISNALHREIKWKCDASLLDGILKQKMFMKHLNPPFLVIKDDDVYEEGPYRWISVTSRNTEVHGMQTIPETSSSFFLAFERSNHPQTLPHGLFEQSSKLGVLILCCCAFNFTSPPFMKCGSLRFLGMDHCSDDKTIEGEDHTEWSCLYSLLVLDLRYTNWNEILSEEKLELMSNMRELNIEGTRCWQYATVLQGRQSNLQRLRIIKPTCQSEASKDVDNSFMDKTCMEILDLSGNSDMEILPISLSKASSLEMLVLDGCDGLENVAAPSRLPPSLKSFSFDGYGPASQWKQNELPQKQFRPSRRTDNKDIRISQISLEGCAQLENLFLRGLPNLVELDLSGTAIKILDFKTMVLEVPRLKRLFLIGCKHLRAIISPHKSDSKSKSDLELICIDTRATTVFSRPSLDKNKSFRLQMHAVVVDARITHSLWKLLYPYVDARTDVSFNIHITSSPVYDAAVISEAINKDKIDTSDQESLQQLIPAGRYGDVRSMVGDAPMQAFPRPLTIKLDQHVEIDEGSCCVDSALGESLGSLVVYFGESLHLHDLSIRAFTSRICGLFSHLRRCCVERCSKLDTIFRWHIERFDKLESFWASDLLMARSIWGKCPPSAYFVQRCKNLQHLHLRSCPRLQFVLPVSFSSFPGLETLHIIHCGDLRHIFILDEYYLEEITNNGVVLFPKLTTIYLHDLPKLQKICESFNMVAPTLESIKIRGCWSLRRLPSVAARGVGEKKPTVEIEKDVWDALEWDAGHSPDHFEVPVHSRYYRKKMPRGSVLR